MRRIVLAALVAFPVLARAEDKAPSWAEPMRKVHAKFTGTKGTLALFGDSITVSMAFWAGLPGERKGMDDATKADFETVNGRIKKECWRGWRGPAYGNEGRMTIRWADENVAKWLKKLNPETAVIMFGTNDLTSVPLEEYEKKLRAVAKRCLDNGTVPILTTIPPRSGMLEKSKKYAEAVRRVAKELEVPLCDYQAAILERRPDDWDGAAEKFKGHKTYEVPTLVSTDGVHPSNPSKFANDYSAEGVKSNGFVLRNWVTLRSYAAVIRHAYGGKK
ncbi:MAG: SGNH/GDSL hydrolase family protein [Gemmataceae bacterium]|nr:SGNH/GDSL hydrolase family protein [Gemmataceae bacterium]